jgi:ribonuclease P protein component
LSQSLEFQRLRRSGRGRHREDAIAKVKSAPFLILCLSAEQTKTTLEERRTVEFGILTSKKQVSKSAVVRNRAKRRVRAAMAELEICALESLMIKNKSNRIRVLIVCHRDCLTQPFDKLKAQLFGGLEKLIPSIPRISEETP